MSTVVNWSGALNALQAARRVWLTTHIRPDGDAIGSVVALTLALRAAGKTVTPVFLSPAGTRYSFLLTDAFAGPVAQWDATTGPADLAAADTVVVVDTASKVQLEGVAALIEASPAVRVAIDHHATRDLAVSTGCYDPSAAATCVMLLELIETAGWTITPAIAEALLTGIGSDTGWFRYSNTDPRTLRAAARLLEAGVAGDVLYQRLFMSDTLGRTRLIGRVIQNADFLADGRLAVTTLSKADFAAAQATAFDREGLLDALNQMGSVVASALCGEDDGGIVRVSLRSKRQVNVAAVAQQFGGGGHERASGCRITAPLPEAAARIKAALLAALG